jgi:hypothetical protein
MAWTTPGTAVAGNVLTAAFWNSDVRDNMNTLVASGTALPSSPGDGESFYYIANATSGTVWHLRYRSAATGSYKWEFVGGSQLISTVFANENRANSAYGDLATSGPSITVPLAGDYIVTIGFTGNNGQAGQQGRMSYAIGGTAASDSDCVFYVTSVAAGNYATVTKPQLKTAISSNTAITAKYRTDGSSVFFQDRFMQIIPVRVG